MRPYVLLKTLKNVCILLILHKRKQKIAQHQHPKGGFTMNITAEMTETEKQVAGKYDHPKIITTSTGIRADMGQHIFIKMKTKQ